MFSFVLRYFSSSDKLPVVSEEVQVKWAAPGEAVTGWRTTVPLLLPLIIAVAQTLISITLRLLWQVVLEGAHRGPHYRSGGEKKQLFTQLRLKVISRYVQFCLLMADISSGTEWDFFFLHFPESVLIKLKHEGKLSILRQQC